ncbi:MAG TPA: type IX secretion system sortase PorU [Melioribacteraceae bacterium]|nr:type IX secretion system sortase PorU [Melioribacteraceae bacterium]
MKTRFSLLFLFFILNHSLFAQDVRVISSSTSSLVIEYRPVIGDTAFQIISGEKYTGLKIPGTFIENLTRRGQTQIPVREINIGVPAEFGSTIQVITSDYTTLPGKYIVNPEFEIDSLSTIEKYYISPQPDENDNSELVTFGDFGLIRSLPVQSIKIYPVQQDKINNQIKVYNRIVFSITFPRPAFETELIKEDFLQYSVINWGVAKKWGRRNDAKLSKTGSTLAATNWYRFEAPEEGIYRIDRTTLQNLGADVNNLDPRTIKIFSNGGYNLPENYIAVSNRKFQEIAISVTGESDGRFDSGDYILFYGRGPEFWDYNPSYSKIMREKHFYSKKNYYWLTFGGSSGKRISEKPSLNQGGAYQQTFSLAYKSSDKDSVNIGKTGRDYLGDEFNSTSLNRTYLTSLNGIVPSSRINYRFRMVNSSAAYVPLRLDESNNQIYSSNIAGFGSNTYSYGQDLIGSASFQGNLSDERSNLKFTISSSSPSTKVYLDYFEIEYRRQLSALNDNFLLFSKDTSAVLQYTVVNFSNSSILVYDVTDYAGMKIVTNTTISGGQVTFQISEQSNKVSKYLIVNQSGFKTPVNGAAVTTQDIRGNTAGTELIIITHKDLRVQAERYAAYRTSQSPAKITASVYFVDDIMNEFSAGMLDPTSIRDFLKYAYDNWQTKPFYVLFFGDGDYDYLNSEKLNKNYIPTYQKPESLDKIYSYPTDDYFARVSGNDLRIDLAIGRLNVQSLTEAQNVVDKIIQYETSLEKGLWRTNITLVADDGPQELGYNDGSIHTSQSENLSNRRIPQYFDQNKIYLAAYPTAISGLGRRKPDVNKAIVDAVNNGTLILNFIGHGNPNTWTHEYVFEKASSIPQLSNKNYFFLTAATCDFGKYDNPGQQSSTEIMINMKDAGAIGAFTAARVVYSTQNAAINDSLFSNLFRSRDENNLPYRIGRSYFLAKQFRTEDNDEKFHLFCDPTIRLAQPLLQASIDSINNKSINSTVQINALGEVKVKGRVINSDGTNSNYSGEAIISVYDSERQLYLSEMNYYATLQGGLIFRGRTNVTNGIFNTEFIVPKDISYENKRGKVSAYVFNQSQDGIGFTSNVIVGGTNPNAVNDGKGPEIEIFFDDESFGNSYLVNPDFVLIARIKDGTGLNTTGTGIGHKLEGILNDDDNNSIDFTNFFIGDLNSGGKSGVIRFKFSSMPVGDYNIKVKAWDVFNNFSLQETNFSVVNSLNGITVRDIYNYPNPFSSSTTFTFQHNIASPINVKIRVYTVAGRMIKEIEEIDILNKFVRIEWDGRDNDGNNIGNGTYLYKLTVESSDGKYKDNVLGKLSVIK